MQKAFAKFFDGLICCAAILALSIVANAQFKAALQGTVTDSTGAAVVGATVVLTNTENNKEVQTVTSDDGFYRFNGLAPGNYKIAVTLTNFKQKYNFSVARK